MSRRLFKKLTLMIAVTLICSQLYAFEKVGVTSFQFLKVMPDARSTSMGEAYSSVAKGADGMYWNPAAMMETNGISVNLSSVDYIFDTGHYGASVSYSFNGFALGTMFMSADYGDIEVTDVAHLGYLPDGTYNPGLTGEVIHPSALVVGLGLAQRLTNKFSYGVSAKFTREDMAYGDTTVTSVLMWDLGILYDTRFKSIHLAATIRNFGPKVEYFDYAYPLPQTMNIGISANILGKTDALLKTNNKHQLLVAFDLVQPRDYDQQYNVGFEYVFIDLVALRIGYKINYDTEGLTFGAGLYLKGFRVDYSFNNYGKYLTDVHRFSFSFSR